MTPKRRSEMEALVQQIAQSDAGTVTKLVAECLSEAVRANSDMQSELRRALRLIDEAKALPERLAATHAMACDGFAVCRIDHDVKVIEVGYEPGEVTCSACKEAKP